MMTCRDCERVKLVLGTLISWMASAANSPIRIDEAEELLRRLNGQTTAPRKKP
jgi:hypothetical protein